MLRHTDQLLSALVSSRRCLRKPAVPQVFLRFLGLEEEESGFQILPWSDQVDFSPTTFLIQVKEPFLPPGSNCPSPGLANDPRTRLDQCEYNILWVQEVVPEPADDGRLSISLFMASRVTRFLCLWSHGEAGCLGMKSTPATRSLEPSLSCISWWRQD